MFEKTNFYKDFTTYVKIILITRIMISVKFSLQWMDENINTILFYHTVSILK